eukprot:TRINITY_DN18815_c0_g1_i1.p1 TRINITY_DN18815_c0_g1~~TRINITY_DN18815_c0_g1_i1.p1  ORF type:complete len:130 (-),score=10.97 TRINITY_DN18815_c0_g1_i1:92-481(-)
MTWDQLMGCLPACLLAIATSYLIEAVPNQLRNARKTVLISILEEEQEEEEVRNRGCCYFHPAEPGLVPRFGSCRSWRTARTTKPPKKNTTAPKALASMDSRPKCVTTLNTCMNVSFSMIPVNAAAMAMA